MSMERESFFTPYAATDQLPGQHIAVLAPHPDDEVFGCGGTLCAMAAAGAEISVAVISGGGTFGEHGYQNLESQRREESLEAARLLGYSAPQFWGLRDGALNDEASLMPRIAAWIELRKPDVVLVPSVWEMHRDHRAVAEAALRVCVRQNGPALAFYEIGQPLLPNRLIDITAYQDKKQAAMRCFRSQLAMQAYDRHIAGLNTFRTYTLSKSVLAAEAFHWVEKSHLSHFQGSWQPDLLSHSLREAQQRLQDAEARHELIEENLRASHEDLVQRLKASESTLQGVLNSKSWQVTRPLRKLMQWRHRTHDPD